MSDEIYRPYKPKGLRLRKSKQKPGKIYAPLWQAIKEKQATKESPVRIACPPELRKRVAKAVAKEKSLDTEWPLQRYRKVRSVETADGLNFWLESYRQRELIRQAIIAEEED